MTTHLLSLDALVVHLRAGTKIRTSVSEQVMRTYAAYKILTDLYNNEQTS